MDDLGVLVPVLCGCGGSETESRPEPFTLWIIEYSIDDFTDDTSVTVQAAGENRELRLSLGCYSDGSVSVLLGFDGLGYSPRRSRP